jgi:hypothetical protein
MTQRKTPLFSVVVDPHNIRLQLYLMLRWVLLCDYCSCFYIFRRPLKFVGLSMPVNYRHFLQVSSPLFRVCSPSESSSSIIKPPEGAAVIYVNIPLQLLSYTFFELHDTSMGHARLVCTQFYFSTPSERFGSHRFPSPSNGSLLQFLSTLSLTMVLSVEETLMYFGYMYAPNLTHQGASVITEISSANGYRNPTSPNTY